MHPLGILIIVVILSIFAQYKVYAKIEKFFLKSPTKQISFVGIILSVIELCCLLFSNIEITKGYYVTGFDLVFKHRLIFAEIFFVVNISIILILLRRNLIDRFRYATIFAIINLISWYLLAALEIPKRFPLEKLTYPAGLLVGLNFIIPLIHILIFGVESNKTEPKNGFFKFVRKIGAKIQKEYDKGQAREEKYGKDPSSIPGEYKRITSVFGISAIIFVAVLISWLLAIGFISKLAGVAGYIGLGIIIGIYVIWLLYYFRNKKM